MKNITELAPWQALKAHQKHIVTQYMQDWFAEDPIRFARFSMQVGGILLDYSKNRITQETINLLCDLARATQLSSKIEALFDGQIINTTENRPALHTALRNRGGHPVYVNGENIMPLIEATLEKMRSLTEKVRNGTWLGSTGKRITDIINIGIGGSHLGPLSTTHALADFATENLRCHFISNIDSAHIHEVLKQIQPDTSLFIVSSKSFTTLETITNARTLKKWLQNALGENAVAKHFIAVTASADKAVEFGILPENIFPLWDWVGGRYSIWSAIGLPLALLIGMDQFLEFLRGAYEMDQHFRHADFASNLPVVLGLLGIWYINFFDANNHAIVPYTHHLTHLRTYLQQADMESNGKNISQQGMSIDYQTGPIIWGEQGCNAQHAFHQLLHQGQHLIPVDFILVGSNKNNFADHHDILVASGLSQAQALLRGKSYEEAFSELITDGYSPQIAEHLAQHKTIPGNRPSNTLFLEQMTPYHLGAFLALYEHKIFVQGAIWNINSFDQWGVELGKQLLPQILADLQKPAGVMPHDSSTQGLIEFYKSVRSES
ncbi:MAG: glucose-6-phosphate isomerase [Gammaproteobacteria bacterium]|nr:glucose-6-phosphate isomerase [Gammaproteobacteria bacterium]